MFKVLVGFALGFILSDVIVSQLPQTQKYKIAPPSRRILSELSGPVNLLISKYGVPESLIGTSWGRELLKKGNIL